MEIKCKRKLMVPPTRIVAIDGLRGFACLAVLLFHAQLLVPSGYAGVDVFFVISGFVVSSSLLREIQSTDRLDLAHFYASRIRRLLPTSLAVQFITLLLYALLINPLTNYRLRSRFLAAALFVENWEELRLQTDYFRRDEAASPLVHFWSLSIEEQFYLAWPLVLILSLGPRRSHLRLASVTLVLALGTLAYAWALPPMPSYFSTFARGYQLLCGVGLALIQTAGWLPSSHSWLELCLFVGLAVLCSTSSLSTFATGLLSTCLTWLLLSQLAARQSSPLQALLSTNAAIFAGTISYSVYLWHQPIISLAEQLLDAPVRLLPIPLRLGLVLASLVAGTLSHLVIERSAQRIFLDSRTYLRIIWIGLTATLLVGLSSQVLLHSVDLDLLDKALAITISEQPPEVAPLAPGHVPHIVFCGDSHLHQLEKGFTRLQESHNFTYEVIRLNSCPWMPQERLQRDDAYFHMQEESDAWQSKCRNLTERALDRVLATDAQALVLVSYAHSTMKIRLPSGDWAAPGTAAWLQGFTLSSERTLARLAQYTSVFVQLQHRTPLLAYDRCLAAAVKRLGVKAARHNRAELDSCVQPASYPRGADLLNEAWRGMARRLDVALIDLDFICPTGYCYPNLTVGLVPMFRDSHHLSQGWVEEHVDLLYNSLKSAGLALPERNS